MEERLLRLPSTQALLCLEASARLGSFTRAAAELHLTQGAVSRQVLQLERSLGVTLFQRTRPSLVPTPAGRAYLAETEPLLRRLERATLALRTHGAQGGRLRLSVGSGFATHWLIPRLPDFTANWPQVSLDITTRIGPVDFAREEADAAISFIDAPAPGCDGVALLPLSLSPYAAPAQAARWPLGSGLRQLPRWPRLEHRTVPGAWAGWAASAGASPATVARLATPTGPTYDLMTMVMTAAAAGMGLALLPDFVAEAATSRQVLVRLGEHAYSPHRRYWLSWPLAAGEAPALAAFRSWVMAQAGARSPPPSGDQAIDSTCREC